MNSLCMCYCNVSEEQTQLGSPKLHMHSFVQNKDPQGTAPGGSMGSLVSYKVWCVQPSVTFRAKQGSKRDGARWRCDRRGG